MSTPTTIITATVTGIERLLPPGHLARARREGTLLLSLESKETGSIELTLPYHTDDEGNDAAVMPPEPNTGHVRLFIRGRGEDALILGGEYRRADEPRPYGTFGHVPY
jgi:hypothetical protein